jgi:hypothetical protein
MTGYNIAYSAEAILFFLFGHPKLENDSGLCFIENRKNNMASAE